MLTSCAGTTCHARLEFFVPKIAIFPQFQVYLSKTKIDKTNDKFVTSQSFLSSDIVPTSSKEKATSHFIRFGHSLRSAVSCQRQVVKDI